VSAGLEQGTELRIGKEWGLSGAVGRRCAI
jgi:hypothetical protein